MVGEFCDHSINYLKNYSKLLSFWGVRDSLNTVHCGKIGLSLLLNLVSSGAKILAPLMLGKAVQMFAMGEESDDVGFVELTPRALLIISLVLSAWIKSENHIKNFLAQDVERAIIEKQSMQVIALTHNMSFENHLDMRTQVTAMLMNIINLHSGLATAVTINYQVLFDISLGTILIMHRYDVLIGAEFLAYCFVDLLVFNQLLAFFAKQAQKSEVANKKLAKYANREFEILDFAETVRMFNHQEIEMMLSGQALTKYLNANDAYKLSEKIASVLSLLPFFAANLIPLSFIWNEKILVSDLDDFIFLFGYLNAFNGSLSNLSQAIKLGFHAIKSIQSMHQFISENQREPMRLDESAYINLHSLQLQHASPSIVFDNVYFTYPGNSEPTLKGLSFTLHPGTTVAIIGRSNAGKSTIIRLLYGAFKAQVGEIKINGHNIQNFSQDTLCRIFSCVPQRPELFRDKSIKYNVLYGIAHHEFLKKYLEQRPQKVENAENTYEAIDVIAMEEGEAITGSITQKADQIFSSVTQQVGLDNLPAALINEKGGVQKLSLGQCQRVSIARALTRHSKIFIFDEATSAQDSFTERQVLNTIQRATRDKTKIMITHRLSNLKGMADNVIVLEAGTIVEEGSPEALLERKGRFYHYCEEQRGWEL